MKPFYQKKLARKMRFISDQAGIMDRYLREQENWSMHLLNTRQFILDAFTGRNIETVAVFGTGWLLDLPIEALAGKFKTVLLVDVHHPPQVRKKVEPYPNVQLFESDLTGGGMNFCWKLSKAQVKSPENDPFEEFMPVHPELPVIADAFISLNILNQLDILLVDFLKRKNFRLNESGIRNFRGKIQQFHLDWITEKPGCLVTDIAEIVAEPGRGSSEKSLLHADLPTGKRNMEWIWDFDLSGFYHPDKETRLTVRAIEW